MRLTGMTYNLKNPVDTDARAWPARRPLLAEQLRRAGADVIGTQEGHHQQLREIAADSGRYELIGAGREGEGRGEWAGVLFDPAVLTPVDAQHFWLSDTPEQVGSRSSGWGNTVIRMASVVLFRRSDGGGLHWLDTHLDDRSATARERGAALIADRIRALDPAVPLVVSGDFNCTPDEKPHRILTDTGLVDAWEAVGAPRQGTYGGWRAPGPDSDRIDWILTRGVTVRDARIGDFHDGANWPSDHVPVLVELDLPDPAPER
jgi:endonuclease/exonuclease/phosphatase family metal-dependent hydrolase